MDLCAVAAAVCCAALLWCGLNSVNTAVNEARPCQARPRLLARAMHVSRRPLAGSGAYECARSESAAPPLRAFCGARRPRPSPGSSSPAWRGSTTRTMSPRCRAARAPGRAGARRDRVAPQVCDNCEFWGEAAVRMHAALQRVTFSVYRTAGAPRPCAAPAYGTLEHGARRAETWRQDRCFSATASPCVAIGRRARLQPVSRGSAQPVSFPRRAGGLRDNRPEPPALSTA